MRYLLTSKRVMQTQEQTKPTPWTYFRKERHPLKSLRQVPQEDFSTPPGNRGRRQPHARPEACGGTGGGGGSQRR